MSPPLWEVCRTRAEYRRLWDGLFAADGRPKPDGPTRLKTCRHRLRSVKRDGRPLYRQVPT